MNANQVNSSGCIARYTFENQFRDSSGSGNTLTQVGAVPYVSNIYVPNGQYAAGPFDLSNRFTAPYAYLNGLTNYTISTWAYAYDLGYQQRVFQISDIGYNFIVARNTSNNWTIYRGTGTAVSPVSATLNTWDQIAITSSGSNAYFYLNGTPYSLDINIDLPATIDWFLIGSHNSVDNLYWRGYLKDFQIFDHALSQSEIQNLSSPGIIESSNDHINTSGLLAYYTFENQFRDSSGQGNHLTMTNKPPFQMMAGIPRGLYCAGTFSGTTSSTIFCPTLYSSGNFPDNYYTINAWLYSLTNGTNQRIFQSFINDPDPAKRGYYIYSNITPANNIYFARYNSSGTVSAQSITSPPLNQWHMFTLRQNASGSHILIDGVVRSALDGFMTSYTDLNTRVIQTDFDGYVKNASIYNRALSDTEISNLYYKGQP